MRLETVTLLLSLQRRHHDDPRPEGPHHAASVAHKRVGVSSRVVRNPRRSDLWMAAGPSRGDVAGAVRVWHVRDHPGLPRLRQAVVFSVAPCLMNILFLPTEVSNVD